MAAIVPMLLAAGCGRPAPETTPITESGRNRTPASPAAAEEETTLPTRGDTAEYTVLMSGRPSGRLRQWPGAAGVVVTHYTYADRGRGPDLRQRLRVAERTALPVSLSLTGSDYYKAPVTETLELNGPVLAWRNAADAGRVKPDSGFYVPLEPVPSDYAVLARALLAAPRRTLPLLPGGAPASLTTVGARMVRAGDRAQRTTLHLISGVDLTPVPVWLDETGRLFAIGTTWQMTIRTGYESVAPSLVAAQDSAAAGRAEQLARRLAHRDTVPIVFRNALLYDAEAKVMRPGRTVVVDGERVVAVGPDDEVAAPAGARVIDARGRALLPGLWDMHVHVTDDDGLLHLAGGVTTVRDLANDMDELLVRRARFDSGTVLGPRVLLGGFLDGPGEFAGPTKMLVRTRDEARAAIARYQAAGYDQVKVYSSLEPALFPAIAREAHGRGMRVSGHVPYGMTAERMVRDGADELQHANFLFLNFLADSGIDTRTPARFTAVARQAALLDLRGEPVRRFVKLLADRGTVVDPTLNVFERLFTARRGTLDDATFVIAGRLPVMVRRGLLGGGLPVTPALDDRYKQSFIAMERMVKLLHDAGVPLVAGTDAAAGFALHRELELYSEAGIPNLDILHIATLGAARVMKRDREVGSIAVGKRADLLLVDGNPALRMRDIRRADLVMKGGTWYEPDSLYAAVGIKPAPRKGEVAAGSVRPEDVRCSGPAAVAGPRTRGAARGAAKDPVPLNCMVVDSAAARTPRPRRPVAAPARRPATTTRP